MKRFFLLISILIVFSACSQRGIRQDEQSNEEDSRTGLDQEGTMTPTPELSSQPGTRILAEGQLVSVKPETSLRFTISGRIATILVEPGDQVAAGALLANIDDKALHEVVTQAELQVAQAKNTLALAELNLDTLVTWEPDKLAVEVAMANLAVAETNYEDALEQDSVAANSLTSARVAVDQAQRSVADAQEAYDTAWNSARDWELGDPWRKRALENERDATARAVQIAQESLAVAQANYTLALAGLKANTAMSADAAVASAQQALAQAQTGPGESDINQAQLQVEQATITLDEVEFALAKATRAVEDSSLIAPWSGTILTINSTEGSIVSAGTPVLTLLDTGNLQFITNNLSERDLSAVIPGHPAEITLKAYPGELLYGTVVRVSPQASGIIGDAATFTVIIELQPVDLLLLPGMTGRVEIQPEGTS